MNPQIHKALDGESTVQTLTPAERAELAAVESQMKSQRWSTAVVVTDPWHALRARAMATDQGMDAVMSPTRQGPAVRQRGTQIRYIGRETVAYLYYKIFGKSSGHGSKAV